MHRAGLSESERAKWEKTYKAGIALAEAGEHVKAVETLLQAATIDDRHADLHFRLGRGCLALEQFDKARKHLLLARDLDSLRFRADTRINQIIREVAGEKAGRGIHLVDAQRAFEESARTLHKLPGRELLYEHVHMNPEGNYLLAKVVFERVAATLPEAIRNRVSAPVAAPSLERCSRLMALSGWDRYRMAVEISEMQDKPPFTNQLDYQRRRRLRQQELEQLRVEWISRAALEDAYQYYVAALERVPEDLEIRRNFAHLLQQRRDYEGAAKQWGKLLRRFPNLCDGAPNLAPSWRPRESRLRQSPNTGGQCKSTP